MINTRKVTVSHNLYFRSRKQTEFFLRAQPFLRVGEKRQEKKAVKGKRFLNEKRVRCSL